MKADLPTRLPSFGRRPLTPTFGEPRTAHSRHRWIVVLLAALLVRHGVAAQEGVFALPQFLTNREVRLHFSAPTGHFYRIDVSTDLTGWTALVSFPIGTGTVQHVDSTAPFLTHRFYAAQRLNGTNLLTGDHLATTNGDVVIFPGNHAGLALSWNGHATYVDPVTNRFVGLPPAELILLTHEHSDHVNQTTLNAVKAANARILAPQAVFNALSTALRSITTVLTNGATTNILGVLVEAVPAYNLSASYHPRGRGNGYVLTVGGRRLYISGDTDDTPEMRALPNIDVAFICMRPPFTMNVTTAASAVRAFRPRIVYPYHYLGNDVTLFKQQVGTDLGIEVRLRNWY